MTHQRPETAPCKQLRRWVPLLCAALLLGVGFPLNQARGQASQPETEPKWLVLKSDGSVLAKNPEQGAFAPFLQVPPMSPDALADELGNPIDRQPNVIVIKPSMPLANAPETPMIAPITAQGELSKLDNALLYQWLIENVDGLNANNTNSLFVLDLGNRQYGRTPAEIEIDRANYLRLLKVTKGVDGNRLMIYPPWP